MKKIKDKYFIIDIHTRELVAFPKNLKSGYDSKKRAMCALAGHFSWCHKAYVDFKDWVKTHFVIIGV